ncbi:MAG: hypothetical protein P1P89_18720 [Desulfobacterales bacterium]|nr:hypothetical protein [Desulfobacterales bacterium]
MNMSEKITPVERRFGMIAIEKGFITKAQLTDALKEQVEEEVELGTHRFIGAILVEKKEIDLEQLGAVIFALESGQGHK